MTADPLLEFAVAIVRKIGDRTDGQQKVLVTLSVGGMLVTGEIIAAKEFMRSDHFFDTFDETMAKFPTPQELKNLDAGFIHLKNARFFLSAQSPIPTTNHADGVFWRGRLDSVDGFAFLGLVPA